MTYDEDCCNTARLFFPRAPHGTTHLGCVAPYAALKRRYSVHTPTARRILAAWPLVLHCNGGTLYIMQVYRLLVAKTYEMHMFKTASKKLGLDQAVLSGSRPQKKQDAAPTKAEVRGRREEKTRGGGGRWRKSRGWGGRGTQGGVARGAGR